MRSGSHDAVHAYSNAKRRPRCHRPGMPDERMGWGTHALVPRPRMRSSSTLVIDVHTCTIASAQTPAQSGRIRQAGSGRLVPRVPRPTPPTLPGGSPNAVTFAILPLLHGGDDDQDATCDRQEGVRVEVHAPIAGGFVKVQSGPLLAGGSKVRREGKTRGRGCICSSRVRGFAARAEEL